jgi:hypothetical protein
VQGGFKPGTWAQLGDIECSTHKGQSDKHGNYYQYDTDKVNVLENWNGLWGARNAIKQSVKVADFWKKGREHTTASVS